MGKRDNISDQQNNKMEELLQVIKDRFQKVNTFCQNNHVTHTVFRFKQEQKIQSQKENWIIAMLKTKRTITPPYQISYLHNTYAIMQIIQPSFNFQIKQPQNYEHFLNQFISLYTTFFAQFQKTFNFKVKLRNMLRPNNQNIVIDLIKYLLDFSRDYTQHLYFWQLKNQRQNQIEERSKILSKKKSGTINVGKNFFNSQSDQNSVKTIQNLQKKKDETSGESSAQKQKEFNRLYGVLDIQPQSNFVLLEKQKMNPQALKQKMNEIYRDLKWRNYEIKKSLMEYWAYCFPKNPNPYRQTTIKDFSNGFPFNISLMIEKNGFSCLHVAVQNCISPTKQSKSYSPCKESSDRKSVNIEASDIQKVKIVKKSPINPQLVLNSLKVLKISQNFLPPLIENFNKSSVQEHSIKDEMQKNQRISSSVQYRDNGQELEKQKLGEDRRNNIRFHHKSKIGIEQRRLQNRRLSEIRRDFVYSEKGRSYRKGENDSQQKIIEWLDKINMMKQLERRKIMGLS